MNTRAFSKRLHHHGCTWADDGLPVLLGNYRVLCYRIHHISARRKVSWNKRKSCWQLGKGTHVSFKKIAQIAVRWYAHGWDFERHTRDSEVRYPEDVEISPLGDEFKHLMGTLMPAKGELTRRIVTTPASEHFYYLDVIPYEDDLFIAEYGNFDDYKTHRKIGQPADFWTLEMKTVLPMLRGAKVLSYRSHTNFSRMGRV
ncbi:MAG: hypothetical protein ACOYB1_01450 [Limnohabitans sp.]